jgi:adenosylhomocysteinase
MKEAGKLLVPAINVNDSVTKSKFDNLYGCRESLADGIKRATDVMVAGKVAVVCGYGDVGKGCAHSLRGLRRARHRHRDRSDQRAAGGDGRLRGQHDRRARSARGDIYVTTTGNKDIITLEHMAAMKDRPSSATSATSTTRSRSTALNAAKDVKKINIKPQVDKYTFADGNSIYMLAEGRLVNLGCATGHPSFVMSNSFSNQTLAQLDLWANKDTYEDGLSSAEEARRRSRAPAPGKRSA